jgi:hypothetical protein
VWTVDARRSYHSPRQSRFPDQRLPGEFARTVVADGFSLIRFCLDSAATRGTRGRLAAYVHETDQVGRRLGGSVQDTFCAVHVDREEFGPAARRGEAG